MAIIRPAETMDGGTAGAGAAAGAGAGAWWATTTAAVADSASAPAKPRVIILAIVTDLPRASRDKARPVAVSWRAPDRRRYGTRPWRSRCPGTRGSPPLRRLHLRASPSCH